jgi:hypothetical protein
MGSACYTQDTDEDKHMNTETYLDYWNRAKPAMENRLNAFKRMMSGQTELTFSDYYEGGDEEFKLSLDLRNANGTCVIGLDFILLDADVNGHEETPGVDVVVELLAAGGLFVGTNRPFPHTQDQFTADIDDMLLRIEGLDVEALAQHVLTELRSDAVRQAVEGIEGKSST